MNLFAELRRRNVIRMAGLYLVGAWLVVQVAATLLPVFTAPAWVMKVLVGMLTIGFAAALVFSWVYELTSDGLKRDGDVAAADSIAPQTARRMDRMLLVVMALALAYFAFDKFVLTPGRMASAPSSVAAPADGSAPLVDGTSDSDPGPTGAPAAVNPKSIAVLAFADMSPAKDSEYLSDGIAEEILNALAQVRDLKVAGRTASFYYKGRDATLKAIGSELGVAHVLEGSVRRQGERVRITAQLIRADNGFHLWSDTYDGDLVDVFALQERIARAISDALQVVLSNDQKSRLVDAGTTDARAYALYLQAAAIFSRRETERNPEAIALLEQALKLDPRFARAASRIAILQANLANAQMPGALSADARRNAQRAIALDPGLAEPHLALGVLARRERRFVEARAHFDRALALEPGSADVGFFVAQNLMGTGYTARGTERLDRTLLIDPLHPNALWRRALQYVDDGDLDAAEHAFSRASEMGLAWAWQGPILLADARGDFGTARKLLDERASGLACLPEDATAYPLIDEALYGGDAAARARALAVIDACLATRPEPIPSVAATARMRLGEPALALAAIEAGLSSNEITILNAMWGPQGRDARRLPQFAGFARKMGFAELWDQYGAPDRCAKNPNGDYRCD
jgi:TolB-like protein